MSYSIDRLQTIVIGRRLDGGVDTVEFDCHGWLKRYPELTDYRVEVTNPAGDAYHPEKVEMQDGRLIWTIMPSDTAIEGEGMYQIVATGKNGERKTSANCATIIKNIMPEAPSGAPPEAAQTWLDQAINAARRAEEAARKAENRDGVQTVNGNAPDENGNVTLDPKDVNALPTSGGEVDGDVTLGQDRVNAAGRRLYFKRRYAVGKHQAYVGLYDRNGGPRPNQQNQTSSTLRFYFKHEVTAPGTTGGGENFVEMDENKTTFAKPIAFADDAAKDTTLTNLGAVAGNQGAENAGKIMYVGADGTLIPLALGAGLEIRDGVLVVTATGTVAAEITVDEAGNAIVTGATMTVDEAGNATFTGAVLTVDEAGNATLK